MDADIIPIHCTVPPKIKGKSALFSIKPLFKRAVLAKLSLSSLN